MSLYPSHEGHTEILTPGSLHTPPLLFTIFALLGKTETLENKRGLFKLTCYDNGW